jgi:hypothetical protein
MNASECIIKALNNHGRNPITTGPGTAKAHCPVTGHGAGNGDRNPSLAVFPRKDGKGSRVECFAGCDYRDVLDAIELRPRDMYDDEPIRQALKPVTHQRYPNGSYKTRQPKPGGGKKMRWQGTKDNQLYLSDKIPIL